MSAYDSPRMEAAMKALREDLEHPYHDAPRRAATLALAAADAVMFSDEAVELAENAFLSHMRTGRGCECGRHTDQDPVAIAQHMVGQIIAALKGDTLESRYACWTCDDCNDLTHEGRAPHDG